MTRFLTTAAAAFAFQLVVSSPALSQESTKDAYHWTGRIDAGRWIRIVNLNGNVTFGTAPGADVEVVATEHWHRGDPSAVRFDLQKGGADGGDVTICALWGTQSRCDNRQSDEHDDKPQRNNDLSVEFRVLVPRGVRVGANAVNGSVDVEGVTGEVDASTVNGSVEVTAADVPISASTVNGSIKAHIAHGTSNMNFRTVNGDVVADFPTDLSADVDLSTVTGTLRSDYEMTVSGKIGGRRMRAHIGKPGGPKVTLTTVNGNVELRRG